MFNLYSERRASGDFAREYFCAVGKGVLLGWMCFWNGLWTEVKTMRLRMMTMGLALGACCLASVGSVAASAQMKMDEPMKMGATSPAKALDDLLSLYEHERWAW